MSGKRVYLVSEATREINLRTGMDLSERTVRTYCKDGTIPAHQPHGARGRYRIWKSDLNAFITANHGSVDNGDSRV